MKNSRNLAEMQEEAKNSVLLEACLVCGKRPQFGYYGRWGDTGTCSRKCEATQQEKKDDEHRTDPEET